MAGVDKDDMSGISAAANFPGVRRLEGEIASIGLRRQLAAGNRMEYAITLREKDIPLEKANFRVWAGDKFFRFKDGEWHGEGGVYGRTTELGRLLEASLQAQLKEEEEESAKK